MKRHEAYPSRYLKPADIEEPVVATIKSVTHEAMQDGVVKPIAFFSGFSKGCIVNVTNADVLYALAGTDDDVDWPGLTVELFTQQVRSPKGGMIDSICFRSAPKKKAAKATANVEGDKIPF